MPTSATISDDWTTDLPRLSGYYWFREYAKDNRRRPPVILSLVSPNLDVAVFGDSVLTPLRSWGRGEWKKLPTA